MKRFFWLMVFLGGIAAHGLAAEAVDPEAKLSDWNGYRRLDFTVAGRPCLLVVAKAPAAGLPWIWRTEFFGTEPQADLALLARGWCVGYMDVKDMYGSPQSIALLGQYYAHIVAHYGLSKRVVLEGFSRGGLYAFNFAAAHPNRVAALYLDAPVLDIFSWPGHHRESKEWHECLDAYGLTEETLPVFNGNAIDKVAMVAKGNIPIIAVCGDADTTVPFAENAGRLEKLYPAQGGVIQVLLKSGVGHHPHSLPDPAPIVDFLVKYAKF